MPYAFDYFRQADSSTTRKFGGLGLGLAIVRNIVEIHGGTVKAESLGEDQGATFVVRLPLLLNTGVGEQELDTGTRGHGDTQNVSKQISGSSSSDPVSMLEGLKVLVVDDDADSRNFVAFVLTQQGAEVMTASSAFEALQALAQSKPDVLISDISMPDIDGYTLIRQVRTWTPEQGGQIPAIALTAFARDYDQQQALLSGFQMHLPKPLNSEELVAAVLNLIAVVNDSNRSGG